MAEMQSANSLPASEKKTAHDATGVQQTALLSYLQSTLFVVSSAVIGFAAFRNTLTWQLQRFWDTSGESLQSSWDSLLDVIGDDPLTLVIYGLTLYTFAFYWIIGSLYLLMDVTLKPAVLRKYKIQPGTNEPVDKKRLMSIIGLILFNQTVVALPYSYLLYSVLQWRGFPPVRKLPTFQQLLTDLAAFVVIVEITFYYSHRLLHSKYLYRFVHKKHHEWTSPIAVTSQYCHPIEHLFSNLLSVTIGPMIMGSHMVTWIIWSTMAILSSMKDHSGYNLPFLPSSEPHDFHHLKFNQCFGVIGVLDRLHGTDDLFRKWKANKRDVLKSNQTTTCEAFPDKSKHKTT